MVIPQPSHHQLLKWSCQLTKNYNPQKIPQNANPLHLNHMRDYLLGPLGNDIELSYAVVVEDFYKVYDVELGPFHGAVIVRESTCCACRGGLVGKKKLGGLRPIDRFSWLVSGTTSISCIAIVSYAKTPSLETAQQLTPVFTPNTPSI
jgi:hypothetical protein